MKNARRIKVSSYKRTSPKRRAMISLDNAQKTIAGFGKGQSICGFTKGQFSLIDLIKAVLEYTGPAHVTVSTWTTGVRDAENTRFMLQSGAMLSFTLLTDRSFPIRQPEYCAKVLDAFGEESIICTNTHAKFAMLKNDEWNVIIRSSMNLNRNPRFEQFDLDDCAELMVFFESIVAELKSTHITGAVSTRTIVDKQFDAAFSRRREEEKRVEETTIDDQLADSENEEEAAVDELDALLKSLEK